ncbi:putative quinol monooxygenase [Nonomuraea typhae]|uniref:putative quinol monooxygenase n=1 Tax=Nonomuraea typhae TaxID=2603600 RepID=UPI0012F9B924|nr:antibiotic biosynthesis monooxygenase [Nonomuraea typhae]
MEILVAVLAFAGALLAAIATGALIRNLREEREGWLIAWTVAAAMLCVALGAVGTGYLVGFGETTFRIYQLAGSLIAPLWMAIGLIQLLTEKTPPKFLAWLFGIAFTIVTAVVIVFDPVLKGSEMVKVLPSGSAHWGLIAGYTLVGAHVIDGLILLGCVVLAALRWRGGDDYDTDNLHATLVIAPSALALIGALRFSVPGIFTTALLVVAAAAIWYSVLRPLAPYEDEDEEADIKSDAWDRPSTGRRAMAEQTPARMEAQAPIEPVRPRSPGLGDLVAEYRAGDPAPVPGYAAPMDAGPSTGYVMNGQEQAFGQEPAFPQEQAFGRHSASPQQPPQDGYNMPNTGVVYPGAELFTPSAPQPVQGGRPSPNIYGLLTVFTLMDGSGEMFDRLAEQTVEAVRRGEPDTLVYACHAVKSAPLQRIVYELYRDEVAFQDHQRQPHVERFVAERQAMVLATNIIELTVNAAKVVPLPTALF